jgi:hypothetical protein
MVSATATEIDQEPRIGHRWERCGDSDKCVNCGTLYDRVEMPSGHTVKMYFVAGHWTGKRPDCVAH